MAINIGHPETLGGYKPTRRELIVDMAIIVGGGTLAMASGSWAGWILRELGTPEELPFIIPEGLLLAKEKYTDDEIQEAVNLPGVVRGANAIMVDRRASEFGVPVLIPAQIPGRGVTTVELLIKNQVMVSETTPECLILPKRPLKNWWPTSNPDLPPGNIIAETVTETQKGVDWLNELLRSNRVTETHIRTGEEVKINLVPDGGSYNQMSCDVNNCIQDIPIPAYAATVRGADGGGLRLNGQNFYYLDYIDSIHYAALIFKTLHERVHTATAGFGFVEKYYENELGNIWTWALEKFTDGLAGMAVEHVFLPNEKDSRRLKALQNWTGNIGMMFIKKVSSDLDNGLETVLHHGATGDMVGLQQLYDSKYGKNAFYNLRNTLTPH